MADLFAEETESLPEADEAAMSSNDHQQKKKRMRKEDEGKFSEMKCTVSIEKLF